MKEYLDTIFEEILLNVIAQFFYVVGTMCYLHELGIFNDSVKNITNPVEVMFNMRRCRSACSDMKILFAAFLFLLCGGRAFLFVHV